MQLIVGTDSTWSLRAWICSQLAQIDLNVVVIDLTSHDYKTEIFNLSSSGLVPALINGPMVIHDSLAITEYFNECAKDYLFPSNVQDRAMSRSLCAELHSGFVHLRTQCPFTLDTVTPLSDFSVGIKNEITRLESIFEKAHLPYMFPSAGAVDAYYSILAYRLKKYGVILNGKAGQYQQSLLDWSYLQEAIKLAKDWKTNQ